MLLAHAFSLFWFISASYFDVWLACSFPYSSARCAALSVPPRTLFNSDTLYAESYNFICICTRIDEESAKPPPEYCK